MPLSCLARNDDNCRAIENDGSSNGDQILVRLENVTHVIHLPHGADKYDDDNDHDGELLRRSHVLQISSKRTGWPLSSLCITDWSPPFCSIRVVSCIRGGKGGFGTLLKGQSKQAGAKMTTDFGACRDLQGRRLRHVNDEIKLRRWRELQQRKAAGEDVNELSELLQTPTGLYNWYLLTPNWAGLSGKGTRKVQRQMKRQFRQWQSEEEEAQEAKRMRDEEYQQSVAYYVNQTMTVAGMIQKSTAEAVLKGMAAVKQQQQQRQKSLKRELKDDTTSERELLAKSASAQMPTDDIANIDRPEDQQPQSLLTLTGDVVIEKSESAPIQIQSKADFSTMAMVLDSIPENAILYFEIKVLTGGLTQVGWAAMSEHDFHPNSETGDGVGDDVGSFGYDGSRGLKFHQGKEEPYGKDSLWKAGDVVGCIYDSASGRLSFSLNGSDLGTAFTATTSCPLVPALSSNQDEILEFRIHANEMQHQPTGAVPVGSLLQSPTLNSNGKDQFKDDKASNDGAAAAVEEQSTAPAQKTDELSTDVKDKQPDPTTGTEATGTSQIYEASVEPINAEPLDLDNFSSAKELEELGLDRLKGALMALGVKCG